MLEGTLAAPLASSRRVGAPVIVPELPREIRELKAASPASSSRRSTRSRRGSPSAARSTTPRSTRSARRRATAGFAMLNMPAEHGGTGLSMLGQVALEEEAGKATNGLGFAVVDRGPRELLELATPEQASASSTPIVRGEYREAWALTEPGAGSDLSGLQATRRPRRRRLAAERREVVRDERGRARRLRRRGRRRRRADTCSWSSPDTPGSDRAHAGLPARPVPRPPPGDRLQRLPRARGAPHPGRRRRRREGVDPRRAAVHRRALLRRRRAAARPRERLGEGARGVRRADRRVPGRVVPARRLADGAARRAAAHVPRGARVRRRSPTARSSTARCRWRSSSRRRRPAGSPIARCRCSAAAAT